MPLGLDQETMRMLWETFSLELDEQIQSITDGLLVLERGLDDAEKQRVLEEIFRSAHNIKGAARGIEATDVSEIAHHLESIFAVLKRENKNPDGKATDLALESMDAMRQASAALLEQRPLEFDTQELIFRLKQAVKIVEQQKLNVEPVIPAQPVANDKSVGVQVPQSTIPVSDKQSDKVSSAQKSDKTVQSPAQPDENVVSRPVRATDVVRVNLEKLEGLSAMLEELQITKIEMDDHLASVMRLRNLSKELTSNLRRDNKNEIDRKTKSGHESWLTRSADVIKELDLASAQTQREMRSSTNRLGMFVGGLQDNVRMMRLVPVSSLLRSMTRPVRDIARELDKRIRFEIQGDDIEIDRVVLEGVRDPLMHILRNAVDHGIESPQLRMDSGKSPEGKLIVSVHNEGSQILMIIQDDGLGISAEQIATTALNKKIISETELAAMASDEKLDLIFRPGFSSKDIITSISGRGVGLDVVVANLRKLKGSVQVKTEEGKGTQFILRLPITLATEHGVLVRAGGNVFVIPTSAVNRVMEIKPEQIIEVEASHAILHRGRSIPLRDLAETLELDISERINSNILPVIVISKGWESVAFLVDEIIGEREIVVKPFRPPLYRVRNITGGTLTGSGEVIMVLNPSELVDSALSGSLHHQGSETSAQATEKSLRILVVDDSITTRSLEKSILEHAGYKTSVAVNGKQAWNMLQDQVFDLVLTDIEMPEMNGFELTALIKQSERFHHLPVVIVTSLAKEEDRQRGIEVGAEAFIVKGQFETKILLDVVGQLI